MFRDVAYDQRIGLGLTRLTKTTPGTPTDTIADVAATGVAPGNLNLTAPKADIDTSFAVVNQDLANITAKLNSVIARVR